MKTMVAEVEVRNGFEKGRTAAELPRARRFVRPLPVVAGLPEPSCSAKRSQPYARRTRSIWIAPEGDRLGEKLLFLVLIGVAVFGIVEGFSFLMTYVENSALIQQAMARLLLS